MMHRVEGQRELLGTKVSIVLVGFDESRCWDLLERAFAECARIERNYSRFLESSLLSQLNGKVGEWMEVPEELYELISFAERTRERSEGAFDITIKSILDGWGYDAGYSLKEHSPGRTGKVELKDGKVFLHAPIDLGGLGKGYALDRMLTACDGLANVFIDAGGDIVARGKQEDDSPWIVAFEHPTDLTRGIGQVEVDGFAVACSSPSRRQWRNRHHLVDPYRALPAENMLAVYTQAPAALLADTYSTALFALGFDRAQDLLPQLPIEAMLVAPDGRVFVSEGFKGTFFV
jgi:thiamine biosynthesis lipoprotein